METFITFGFEHKVGGYSLANHYMKVCREEFSKFGKRSDGTFEFAFEYPMNRLGSMMEQFKMELMTVQRYKELLLLEDIFSSFFLALFNADNALTFSADYQDFLCFLKSDIDYLTENECFLAKELVHTSDYIDSIPEDCSIEQINDAMHKEVEDALLTREVELIDMFNLRDY